MKCKAKEKHWALKCFCGHQLVMCRPEFKPLKLKISSQESESASLWSPPESNSNRFVCRRSEVTKINL